MHQVGPFLKSAHINFYALGKYAIGILYSSMGLIHNFVIGEHVYSVWRWDTVFWFGGTLCCGLVVGTAPICPLLLDSDDD